MFYDHYALIICVDANYRFFQIFCHIDYIQIEAYLLCIWFQCAFSNLIVKRKFLGKYHTWIVPFFRYVSLKYDVYSWIFLKILSDMHDSNWDFLLHESVCVLIMYTCFWMFWGKCSKLIWRRLLVNVSSVSKSDTPCEGYDGSSKGQWKPFYISDRFSSFVQV